MDECKLLAEKDEWCFDADRFLFQKSAEWFCSLKRIASLSCSLPIHVGQRLGLQFSLRPIRRSYQYRRYV